MSFHHSYNSPQSGDGNYQDQQPVEKSYLIDRYPELADTFKQAGLWVWGKNNYGQIGDNTIVYKSSPVQTSAGGTNWKSVSSGNGPTIAAIKTDGTLWTWGNNGYGTLGDTTILNKSSPAQTIASGTNWKVLGGHAAGAAAIRDDSADLFGDPV